MPELPEVEAARRAVQEHCCGKRIVRSIVADDPKVVDGVSPSDFQRSLDGKTIVGAHRKGKNMWLQLDSPPFPSFQFGMSGAIYIKGVAVTKYKRSAVQDTDEWPSKYSKVFIELDDGLEFSFTDKRRFAKVRLLQDPASVHPISELGRDALFDPMSAEEFADSLSKKKIAIKPLLLDQAFIAGIGNWMADEVLYQARIHPLRIASSLSKEESELLHNSIKEVIEKALAVGADSNQFPRNWIFHSRKKKPGKAYVDGKKIEFITAGGRARFSNTVYILRHGFLFICSTVPFYQTTAYVPELQKLAEALPETEKGRNKRVVKSNRKEKSQTNEEEGNDEEGASSPAKRKKKQMSSAKEHKGGQKKVAKGDKGNQADKLTKSRKVAKKITKKGVKRSGKIDFDR